MSRLSLRGSGIALLGVAAAAALYLAYVGRGARAEGHERIERAMAESQADDVWTDVVDSGDVRVLRAMVRDGALPVDGAPGPYRDTPLRYAAMMGNEPMVRALLAEGADPNRTRIHAFAPLGEAASQGYVAIAELLLDHGATPQGTGTFADLSAAIRTEDHALVRRMLAAGADPNPARDPTEMTPLMWALTTGEPELVEMLIRAGADVNATRDGGPGEPAWTALRMARHEGFRRISELLVAAGSVDDDSELTASLARPKPRAPRELEPGVDGGFEPAVLEDLRRFLLEPAADAAVASFERRYGVELPAHVRAYLRLSNGLVDLRNYLGAELRMLPVEQWRRKREGADPEDTSFWSHPEESFPALDAGSRAESARWRGIPDAFVVGLSEDGEDELLLRAPGCGDASDWDLLHLQVPLELAMTVHPTIQSFVTERVAGLRADGYLEDLAPAPVAASQ